MSSGSKIGVTLALLLVLGGLAAADAASEGKNLLGSMSWFADDGTEVPAGGVAKNNGPLIADVANELKLSIQEAREESILSQVVQDKTQLFSHVLLQNNDRIGNVTWTESPRVKNLFISLKEALLTSFSPQVSDLKDETFQEPGTPVRNVLGFKDPQISSEAIAFVRVRERIYEFHIAPGKEAVMAQVRAALTER